MSSTGNLWKAVMIRCFVPQVSYYTGDVDAHDLAITPKGTRLPANTLFSCICTVSETHSFKVLWKPPY